MKKVLLQDLLKSKEVQKVRITTTMSKEDAEERLKSMSKAQRALALKGGMQRTKDSFLWVPRQPSEVRTEQVEGVLFGHEVGVGENWDHLNRRRRRAREKKVASDVRWMNQLERAKSGTLDRDALYASRRKQQQQTTAL